MKEQQQNFDIAVIVGRFQTNELHQAHKDLISTVLSQHKKVILFLGVAPVLATRRNPLDFTTRKLMIEEEFGNRLAAILPIYDNVSNELWSQQLDIKIREVFQIGSVVLYGSKDSFIPYYSGKFPTRILEPETFISATDIRNTVSKEVLSSKEFRSGCIYSIYNQFPITYPTVDVAIFNDDYTRILLGRKSNQQKYRFIGGFVDISDSSLEHSATREALEETSLEIGGLEYVGSFNIKDWRYAKEQHRTIMTTLFAAKVIFGAPTPQDDIEELKWFDYKEFNNTQIVAEHIVLLEHLNSKIKF